MNNAKFLFSGKIRRKRKDKGKRESKCAKQDEKRGRAVLIQAKGCMMRFLIIDISRH
jgi:hypothetical protein